MPHRTRPNAKPSPRAVSLLWLAVTQVGHGDFIFRSLTCQGRLIHQASCVGDNLGLNRLVRSATPRARRQGRVSFQGTGPFPLAPLLPTGHDAAYG